MSSHLVVQYQDGRYVFRWRADDGDVWRAILDSVKADFDPRNERRYHDDEHGKRWSVPDWCRARLHNWADEHFAASHQTWRDEDGNLSADDDPSSMCGWHARQRSSGDQRSGQQGQHQRTAPPPPPPQRSPFEQAMATLHLLPTAPSEVAAAAHRAMVKLSHPDMPGGSHEQAVKVNAAWEKISAHYDDKRRRSA